MASTSTLRGYVQPDVPGCPTMVVDRAITIGAREWCDLTQAVREQVDFDTVIGTNGYEIISTYDVARVFSVAYGDRELSPIAGSNLQTRLDADSGEPSFYWMEGEMMYFDKVPASAVAVIVDVAVKPKIDSTSIPDAVARGEAALAVAARAKRELMMSKAPWGDTQMAQFFEAEFQRLARNAVNTDLRNTTNAPIRGTVVFS